MMSGLEITTSTIFFFARLPFQLQCPTQGIFESWTSKLVIITEHTVSDLIQCTRLVPHLFILQKTKSLEKW